MSYQLHNLICFLDVSEMARICHRDPFRFWNFPEQGCLRNRLRFVLGATVDESWYFDVRKLVLDIPTC